MSHLLYDAFGGAFGFGTEVVAVATTTAVEELHATIAVRIVPPTVEWLLAWTFVLRMQADVAWQLCVR